MTAAERLFERILAERTNETQRDKWSGLWKALQQMRDDDVEVYSIALVGSYSEKLGGPKTQSIRNKQGVVFRNLIEAFAENEGKRTKSPRKALPPIEDAIANITDKGTQLAIRLELRANASLKAENHRLKAAFKVLSVVPTLERSLVQEEYTPPSLSNVEFDAVRRFLEDAWIEERLWSREENGSIVEQGSGTLIAPPGFVTALRQILGTEK